MEFRVLGPLEIRGADGEPRVVAAPKQKALLALLLVHRNQVVSVDRLIDEPPFPIAEVMNEANRTLEKSLPAGELERARTRGAAMTVDDAIEFALEADGSHSPPCSQNG